MHRRPLLAAALLLIGLALAVASQSATNYPALTNVWRSPEAFNPTGVPFQMVQVALAESRSSAVGQDGLSIRYAILNTSKDTLTRVGIGVVEFFPSGQIKGFHIFTMKVRIAPGDRVFGTYATAQYRIARGDRLVMVPYSAAGSTLHWVMDKDDFVAVNRSLEAVQGDASSAGMVNLQESAVGPPHNQYPGDPGGGGSCLSTCQTAASQCEATCKCGVSSTGCTCNPDGSLTTSCACFQCPPPKAP